MVSFTCSLPLQVRATALPYLYSPESKFLKSREASVDIDITVFIRNSNQRDFVGVVLRLGRFVLIDIPSPVCPGLESEYAFASFLFSSRRFVATHTNKFYATFLPRTHDLSSCVYVREFALLDEHNVFEHRGSRLRVIVDLKNSSLDHAEDESGRTTDRKSHIP